MQSLIVGQLYQSNPNIESHLMTDMNISESINHKQKKTHPILDGLSKLYFVICPAYVL